MSNAGYDGRCMELTLEAYRNIVKNVRSRADIATLCRVSRAFRRAAEWALYNTLLLQNNDEALLLLRTLSAPSSPQAALIDALTISLSGDGSLESDDDYSDEDYHDAQAPNPVPVNFWPSVAQALQNTQRLRYLTIQINDNSTTAVAWILDGCRFQLRSFHCNIDWDPSLVSFLNKQRALEDLFIHDYRESIPRSSSRSSSPKVADPLSVDGSAMPNLTILECGFSEAAVALVSGRPVTHLKTCFSMTESEDKRKELRQLVTSIEKSTCPLRALDIADSSYAEAFGMEVLDAVVASRNIKRKLGHLGTLVLPVDGQKVNQMSSFTYDCVTYLPAANTLLFVTDATPNGPLVGIGG